MPADCEYIYSSFVDFIILAVITVFSLINVLIGIKRKRALNLVAGCIIPIWHVELWLHRFSDSISLLIIHENPGILFYSSFYNWKYYGVVECFLIAVYGALFIFGIVYRFRSKNLVNTKRDLKIKNFLVTAVRCFIAVTLIYTVIMTVNLIVYKDRAVSEATERIVTSEEKMINNIDRFMTTDKAKVIESAKSVFGEKNYLFYDDSLENYKADEKDIRYPFSVWIYAHSDENSDKLYMSTYFDLDDPFYRNDSLYIDYRCELKDGDINKNMKITDAPLPTDVIYEYNEDFCTVSFYYPNEKKIVFVYNESTGEFMLADTHIKYDKSIAPSKRYETQLKNALMNTSIMSDFDTAEIKITSIIQSSMTDSNVYKINVKFSDSGDFENYLDYSAYTVIVYMNGDEMNILSCEQH